MPVAFLDTTVIADLLLKSGDARDRAEAALRRYEATLLPVYAIKELQQGPLGYFIYVHNKLVQTGSYTKTLEALTQLSATPQRYRFRTALEALQMASAEAGRSKLGSLEQKYGPNHTLDKVQTDMYRIAIQRKILRAWSRRRSVSSSVTDECPCFHEDAPRLERGLFVIPKKGCHGVVNCTLANRLRLQRDQTELLRNACKEHGTIEALRRYRLLRQILRKPKAHFGDQECRGLGDAIFVFLAPATAVILTTNVRDHRPLADALGKTVEPVQLADTSR